MNDEVRAELDWLAGAVGAGASVLEIGSAGGPIPVYLITTEDERERGLRMGAIGALTKPLKSKEDLRKSSRGSSPLSSRAREIS